MTDETTATDETTTGGAAADTKRKVMLLGGMAAALLLFGALYLVWARGRVNEDLADRNERAQQLVDDFEASQGPAEEPTPHLRLSLSQVHYSPPVKSWSCTVYRARTTAALLSGTSMEPARCSTGLVCGYTSRPIMACAWPKTKVLSRHSPPRSFEPRT